MNTLNKTKKILICLSLVIIVAGAFIFGFLGFNGANTEKATYQVSVAVEGYADADKLAAAKTVTEDYFKEIGITPASVDKLNDGAIYRYTFTADVSEKVDTTVLADKVKDVTTGVYQVNAGVYKVEPQVYLQSLYVILAGGIAVVACAVFVFITERFAGAFTAVLSSLFASVLAVSIVALARIPASGYVYVTAAGAAALASVASVGVLARCREIMRNVANEKMPYTEVVGKAIKDSAQRFAFLFIAILLAAIAFFAFGNADTRWLALQIVAADAAAAATIFSVTPLMWAAFKSVRKKSRKQVTADAAAQPDTAVEE